MTADSINQSSKESIKRSKNQNNIKCSDPNYDTIHGRDLIEQIFSDTYKVEFLEVIKKILT